MPEGHVLHNQDTNLLCHADAGLVEAVTVLIGIAVNGRPKAGNAGRQARRFDRATHAGNARMTS